MSFKFENVKNINLFKYLLFSLNYSRNLRTLTVEIRIFTVKHTRNQIKNY